MTFEALEKHFRAGFEDAKARGAIFERGTYWQEFNGQCYCCAVGAALKNKTLDYEEIDRETQLANEMGVREQEVLAVESGFCNWRDTTLQEQYPQHYALGQQLAKEYIVDNSEQLD